MRNYRSICNTMQTVNMLLELISIRSCSFLFKEQFFIIARDVPDVKFAGYRMLSDVVSRIPDPEFGKNKRLRGPIFSPNKLIFQ